MRRLLTVWSPVALSFAAILAILIAPSVAAQSTPANAAAPAGAVDTADRFFGAVQSIYNPDRAAQAGVQWERLIFPWSLIQKGGPAAWTDGYFSDQQISLLEIVAHLELVRGSASS